jgi:hypothetical protein
LAVASSYTRNSPVAETAVQLPFRILDETSFSKFNATGRSMLINFKSPGEE